MKLKNFLKEKHVQTIGKSGRIESGEDKIVIMYNKKTVAIIMKGKTDVVDAEGFSKVMKDIVGKL